MHVLDANLPAGALCQASPAASPSLRAALWWHGSPSAFSVDKDTQAVTTWHPVAGGADALPTEASQGNGTITNIGDLHGLQTRHGQHCGLRIADVTPGCHTTTLALRFYLLPGQVGLTLLTLNTGDGAYLFVSHSDGLITAKDKAGTIHAACPAHGRDAPHLVIVTLNGGRLDLWVDGAADHGVARGPGPKGPADLFIGCRNHRSGLRKTLGAALYLDVWCFPGQALLDGRAENQAALTALRRHHLWADTP